MLFILQFYRQFTRYGTLKQRTENSGTTSSVWFKHLILRFPELKIEEIATARYNSSFSTLLVNFTIHFNLYAECDGVWIVGTKSQQESGENANDGRQHWLQEIRAA